MSHALIPSKPTPKPASTQSRRQVGGVAPRVPGVSSTVLGRRIRGA
ncbi:hypothetical protein [Nocardioides sp. AN3]